MDIKIVNVADVEDLILAKHDFDVHLLENHKISKKMTLDEFMDQYPMKGFGKYIYKNKMTMIPFNYVTLGESSYLFYVASDNVDTTSFLDYMKAHEYKMKMKEIKVSTVDEISNVECIVCENKFFILN